MSGLSDFLFCFGRWLCRPERCHDFGIAPCFEPGFGVVFHQAFLLKVWTLSRGIQFAFSTRFFPTPPGCPGRSHRDSFQNVTISSSWNKKRRTTRVMRPSRSRPIHPSILPACPAVAATTSSPSWQKRTHGTLLQRSTTRVQHGVAPAEVISPHAHSIVMRVVAFRTEVSVSACSWSSSNHGHTFGKMISFLCGSIARAKTRPAQRPRKKYFSRRKEGEGRDGSFIPSSVPNFQGKIAG